MSFDLQILITSLASVNSYHKNGRQHKHGQSITGTINAGFIFYIAPVQCGKPYFSNTRQNGEWIEISTRQNEIELAMFGE